MGKTGDEGSAEAGSSGFGRAVAGCAFLAYRLGGRRGTVPVFAGGDAAGGPQYAYCYTDRNHSPDGGRHRAANCASANRAVADNDAATRSNRCRCTYAASSGYKYPYAGRPDDNGHARSLADRFRG